jgi:ATP-binding protein involved in chromosome partitioning
MMDLTDRVLGALRAVVEPKSGHDIVRLGSVRELQAEEGAVRFTVVVDDPVSDFARTVAERCERAVRGEIGAVAEITVSMDHPMIGLGADVSVDGSKPEGSALADVRNIIAVASGKGGVGKSTVAVNLAVSLARAGYATGLVDTDIYGPSVPTMMGLEQARPRLNDARRMVPVEAHGVRVLSMGFLVDPDRAVIWRGPMVSSAVQQFLGETEWGELDFLVMDLPPGTGDIQLTIVQTIPLAGAVVVSTPQRVALSDARKGVAMFHQVDVPVLGIVENMAWFEPPEVPGKRYYLFGQGGARSLAAELGVPFLVEIPIEEPLREACDGGVPVSVTSTGRAAAAFATLAEETARQVFRRNATQPLTQRVEILHR